MKENEKITKRNLNNLVKDLNVKLDPESDSKINEIIKRLEDFRIQVLDIKGTPKEINVPLTIEEIILEVNYLHKDNSKFEEIVTEKDLDIWINSTKNKTLIYSYKKYLIAWKVLTNDIKTFAPINSKKNINIKPVITFDKSIPEFLKKLIEYEEDDYLED